MCVGQATWHDHSRAQGQGARWAVGLGSSNGAWRSTDDRPTGWPATVMIIRMGQFFFWWGGGWWGLERRGFRERTGDTSRSTGRSGRQNAATRRSTRRNERVTVQGPVKNLQPDGMSHSGGGGGGRRGFKERTGVGGGRPTAMPCHLHVQRQS